MGSILTIIGSVIIFIIGKFIYDSYLTNNTNDNWDKYVESKKSNTNFYSENSTIEVNKSEIISLLKSNLEKALFDVAKKEKEENPTRDNLLQSAFVIQEIESFAKNIEKKMIEEQNEYQLTEDEISSLINESVGVVINKLFKDVLGER